MVKRFEEFINENYVFMNASRKLNGEQISLEKTLMSIIDTKNSSIDSVDYRKENGEYVVDIKGSITLNQDIEEIPLQFGEIKGDFLLDRCRKLKSLKGAPRKVMGDCYIYHCDSLESLEGCPEFVWNVFTCVSCEKLTSLEGCPKEVGRSFHCARCGKQFTEEEVRSLCKTKSIDLN